MQEVAQSNPSEERNISFRQRIMDRVLSRTARYTELGRGRNVTSIDDARLVVIANTHNHKSQMTMGAILRAQSSRYKRVLLLSEAIERGKEATPHDRVLLTEAFGTLPGNVVIEGWDNKRAYHQILDRFRLGIPNAASSATEENAARDASLAQSIDNVSDSYDKVIVFAGKAHVRNTMPQLERLSCAGDLLVILPKAGIVKRLFPRTISKRYGEKIRLDLIKGTRGFSIEDR